MARIRKPEISTTAMTINSDALVNETSYPKISIGTIRSIWNWVMGLW